MGEKDMGVKCNKILFAKVLICMIALAGTTAMIAFQLHSDKHECSNTTDSEFPIDERPMIVIRIDDIQDCAWRDAQITLIKYNLAMNLPMSLAVIPKSFGEDTELVELVFAAITQGSEITAHGWKHERLTDYDVDEQTRLLQFAREKLRHVLGVEVSVMVPPCFAFNNDTLLAMKKTGYTILGSEIHRVNAGLVDEDIASVPATVQFANYVNGTWKLKSPMALAIEIAQSVSLYGYAVIVTHPQEFWQGNEFDPVRFEVYKTLIRQLSANSSFTVIETLQEQLVSQGRFTGNEMNL
jgi:peptidoglycan/xylan/chitin deacetylase (PgdA/CDA1 family)